MFAGSTFSARRPGLTISARRGAILVDSQAPDALSLKTYFGFKEALEALFGRSVDLTEPGPMRNPYLKASIERSREPVFEA